MTLAEYIMVYEEYDDNGEVVKDPRSKSRPAIPVKKWVPQFLSRFNIRHCVVCTVYIYIYVLFVFLFIWYKNNNSKAYHYLLKPKYTKNHFSESDCFLLKPKFRRILGHRSESNIALKEVWTKNKFELLNRIYYVLLYEHFYDISIDT